MRNNITKKQDRQFVSELKEIVNESRRIAYNAVNFALVRRNWLIGQRIVVYEQGGNVRAEYGKHVIELASKSLTEEFGKGFSITNIKNFKAFYLMFNNLPIGQALTDQSTPILNWTNYERLLRVKNEDAREWYAKESANQMWSYRTLDRNISTLYYQRMLSSQAKEIAGQDVKEKTSKDINDSLEFIKNPAVLEFLGLPNNKGYSESALEQAIIDQMQNFLLELGKGFSFVARYSVLNDNKHLFASQYMNYLPSEKELEKEIEHQKELFFLQQRK